MGGQASYYKVMGPAGPKGGPRLTMLESRVKQPMRSQDRGDGKGRGLRWSREREGAGRLSSMEAWVGKLDILATGQCNHALPILSPLPTQSFPPPHIRVAVTDLASNREAAVAGGGGGDVFFTRAWTCSRCPWEGELPLCIWEKGERLF